MIQQNPDGDGPLYAPLLILDDIFPHSLSPFRTIEYEHYLRFFDAFAMSSEGWHSWVGNQSFEETLGTADIDEDLKPRIIRYRGDDVAARLAYVTFLRGATAFLPYLEAKQLPFVFQLYPGGGMAIDQPAIDKDLKRVLKSPLLRRVITTQSVTRDYIVEKIGCDASKIAHIYGGVFRIDEEFDFSRDKVFFGPAKTTIDLCFVAHRYGRDLVSKGYDRFVAASKAIAARFPEARFHVVGGYDASAIPVDELGDRITFYGVQEGAFFREFYPRMDMVLSLNKPFVLVPGAYDGFPTGSCMEAGARGVLNCVNDPLGMNPCFVDDRDIVLLDEDLDRTIERLSGLIGNPARMYDLAYANRRSFRRVFDTDRQLMARTKVIAAELIAPDPVVVSPRIDRSVLDQFAPVSAPSPPSRAARKVRDKAKAKRDRSVAAPTARGDEEKGKKAGKKRKAGALKKIEEGDSPERVRGRRRKKLARPKSGLRRLVEALRR